MLRRHATLLRTTLGLVLGMGAVLLAAPAIAQETGPLEEQRLEDLRCTLQVPKGWTIDQKDADRVAFKIDDRGGSARLRVWWTRKSLDAIEAGLKKSAEQKAWKVITAERRQVGGKEAVYMVCDAPVKDSDKMVRNLFLIVDAPDATYMLHVGALSEHFDQATIDKVCESFRQTEKKAGGAETPKEAPKEEETPSEEPGDGMGDGSGG